MSDTARWELGAPENMEAAWWWLTNNDYDLRRLEQAAVRGVEIYRDGFTRTTGEIHLPSLDWEMLTRMRRHKIAEIRPVYVPSAPADIVPACCDFICRYCAQPQQGRLSGRLIPEGTPSYACSLCGNSSLAGRDFPFDCLEPVSLAGNGGEG